MSNNHNGKRAFCSALREQNRKLNLRYHSVIQRNLKDYNPADEELKEILDVDYFLFYYNHLHVDKFNGAITGDTPIYKKYCSADYADLKLCWYQSEASEEDIEECKGHHFLRTANYQSESQTETHKIPKPLLIIAGSERSENSERSEDTESFDDYLKSRQQVTVSLTTANPEHRKFLRQIYLSDEWQIKAKNLELRQGRYFTHFTVTLSILSRNSENKLRTLNELMDLLLSVVLQSGRPVNYYSATFYLPFRIGDGKEREKLIKQLDRKKKINRFIYSEAQGKQDFIESLENHNDKEKLENAYKAQAYYFFSPTVRNQLFPRSDDVEGLTIWQVKPEKDEQIVIFNEKKVEKKIDISNLELAINNDIGIFNFTVSYDVQDAIGRFQGKDWWLQLFDNSKEQMQLADCLMFSEQIRYLYPEFVKQKSEGKLGLIEYFTSKAENGKIEEDWKTETLTFNRIVDKIITYSFGQKISKTIKSTVFPNNVGCKCNKDEEGKFAAYRDNRLFVSSCYALKGEYHHDCSEQVEQHQRFFKTALDVGLVNSDGGFSSYSQDFADDYFEKYTYKRWQDSGTLMGSNEYACSYVGYGDYMYNEIAKVNVPHIYHKVTLLNLSYRTQLRYFEGAIASEKNRSVANALRGEFVDFANNKWFKSVTEKTQGNELFELQSQAFKLQQTYDQVNHEIAIADDYQRNERSGMYALLSAFLSIVGLLLSLLDRKIIYDGLKAVIKNSNDGLSHMLKQSYIGNNGLAEISLSFVTFLVLVAIFFIASRRKCCQIASIIVQLLVIIPLIVCFWCHSTAEINNKLFLLTLLIFPSIQLLLLAFNYFILSPKKGVQK